MHIRLIVATEWLPKEVELYVLHLCFIEKEQERVHKE